MKLLKNKVSAFTLVELIVVITILAILGTIAFINLQGYSTSARDSKRISDINNIQKKISIELSKGESLGNLIKLVKTNAGLTIDGTGATSIQGTANFQTLKENGESFKDPITKGDYILSYSVGGSGTGAYKFTQISTINEENNQAVVQGNYYQMQSGDSPSITYNQDDTFFVVDGGDVLPYLAVDGGTTPPPLACNYQQADIDILNSAGTNGNIGIYDNDWNTLSFPLTDVQWCYDVNYLKWYGGSTIIPEIFTLNSFNYLDLSDNSLTSIPVEIGNLTNLTVLYLNSNNLTTLPTQIGNLSNLTNLNLSSNQFTSIPVEIGNLSNLTSLSLYNNQLNTLPAEIGNLSNLIYLESFNNQLTTLPAEIGNLSNLDQLDLGNNPSLGNLSYNFNNYNSTLSQAGIPTVGKTMTIGTNGTHIVITITP